MDTSIILSVSSMIGAITFFYTWHKDSKTTSQEMAYMKARLSALENRMNKSDENIEKLLLSVNEIKVIITRIDTQVQELMKKTERE